MWSPFSFPSSSTCRSVKVTRTMVCAPNLFSNNSNWKANFEHGRRRNAFKQTKTSKWGTRASEKRSFFSKINDYIFAIVEIHGLVSSCVWVCVRLMCILVNNRNQFVPQQQQEKKPHTHTPANKRANGTRFISFAKFRLCQQKIE